MDYYYYLTTYESCVHSTTGYLLALVVLLLATILRSNNNKKTSIEQQDVIEESELLPPMPGPKPLPMLGNLHQLKPEGDEPPYGVFSRLAKTYGSVYKLEMGSVKCAVINDLEHMREVMIAKGAHFDGRPDFWRYRQIFNGDKENSLAFCDWSDVQKTRRDMLRAHTFPRTYSARGLEMDELIGDEMFGMVSTIHKSAGDPLPIKPLLLRTCANVFMRYFCSRSFEADHAGFSQAIEDFDEIFYEVNQGYAADFLPFLSPLHEKRMRDIRSRSHRIRKFVLDSVIGERFDKWKPGDAQNDYVDSLVEYVRGEGTPTLSWDMALFALEDIIGGHSAIGNLMVKVLGFVAQRVDVQQQMQLEIDAALGSDEHAKRPGLTDRVQMPYTEAVMLEAIRLVASPIVPHVANRNSSIAGYKVEKGTLIFLNNYHLNMSSELWTDPKEFRPERFLRSGRLVKPEYFLPFGGGRRSCMGYKLVQWCGHAILANLMRDFTVLPIQGEDYKVPIGNLAMPREAFRFRFVTRRRQT